MPMVAKAALEDKKGRDRIVLLSERGDETCPARNARITCRIPSYVRLDPFEIGLCFANRDG